MLLLLLLEVCKKLQGHGPSALDYYHFEYFGGLAPNGVRMGLRRITHFKPFGGLGPTGATLITSLKVWCQHVHVGPTWYNMYAYVDDPGPTTLAYNSPTDYGAMGTRGTRYGPMWSHIGPHGPDMPRWPRNLLDNYKLASLIPDQRH